jgi:hypothetical protein
MGATELLGAARALVQDGWCQRHAAVDVEGAPVDPWRPEARAWSLLGAIVSSAEGPRMTMANGMPLSELALALGALAEVIADPSLADWNDAADRTQTEVVAALAAAGELVAVTPAATAGLALN